MIEKKIKEYEEAIKKDPDNPTLWFEKGKLLSTIGDMEGAINAFQTATNLKPDFFEAWDALGDVYMELEQRDKAVECYKKVVATATKDTKLPNLCPRCGKEIKGNADVCNVCGFVLIKGQEFPETQISGDIYHCPLCGGMVDYNASSCSCCGVPIVDEHPSDTTIVHVLRRELKHTVIPPASPPTQTPAEQPGVSAPTQQHPQQPIQPPVQTHYQQLEEKPEQKEKISKKKEVIEVSVSETPKQSPREEFKAYLESISAVNEIPSPQKKKFTFFEDPINMVLFVGLILGIIILGFAIWIFMIR
ncbi:MAG: tetratricopeptide repeat protein [Thermoplasmata archaeon]